MAKLLFLVGEQYPIRKNLLTTYSTVIGDSIYGSSPPQWLRHSTNSRPEMDQQGTLLRNEQKRAEKGARNIGEPSGETR